MKHSYFVVCDTEVSCSKPSRDYIIQLGAQIVNAETLELGETFNCYAKPDDYDHWNYYSSKHVHKITKEFLKDKPKQIDLAVMFMKFLAPYRPKDGSYFTFVEHSTNRIDFNFVCQLFKRNGFESSYNKVFHEDSYITTFKMFEAFRQLNPEIEKCGLENMSQFFGVELKHHDALSDAKATAECFVKMVRILSNTQ